MFITSPTISDFITSENILNFQRKNQFLHNSLADFHEIFCIFGRQNWPPGGVLVKDTFPFTIIPIFTKQNATFDDFSFLFASLFVSEHQKYSKKHYFFPHVTFFSNLVCSHLELWRKLVLEIAAANFTN